jgi:hypothetical protein
MTKTFIALIMLFTATVTLASSMPMPGNNNDDHYLTCVVNLISDSDSAPLWFYTSSGTGMNDACAIAMKNCKTDHAKFSANDTSKLYDCVIRELMDNMTGEIIRFFDNQ